MTRHSFNYNLNGFSSVCHVSPGMEAGKIVSIDTNVLVPDKSGLKQVLFYYNAGFDFADAWHLLRSESYEMKTFDATFIKKARKSGHLASLP